MLIVPATLVAVSLLAFDGGYLTGDPLGQKACLKLDRDPDRTLSLIRAGKAGSVITTLTTSAAGEPVYHVELHYWLRVALAGEYQGHLTIEYPVDYFTPEHIPALKEAGSFTTPGYKLEFLETRSITTLDGQAFPDCELVRFSNIVSLTESPVRELVMDACIKPGVASIGAAQIDLRGKVNNTRFKAGLDITSDMGSCPPAMSFYELD